VNNKKKNKLNIFPLFGDFSLLIIGLFILSLLMAISKLFDSEKPETIPTDKYFDPGIDTLIHEADSLMDLYIRDSIFNKISQVLDIDPDNLINIRVMGHTDADFPDSSNMKNYRWKTNLELSQFRANEIAKIIEKVTRDSLSIDEFEKLNKKIVASGYGKKQPQADTIKTDVGWWVINISKGDTLDGPFSNNIVAFRTANKFNRRVEISLIKRGY